MSEDRFELLKNIERYCPNEECQEQIVGLHGVSSMKRRLSYYGGSTRVKYTCPVCGKSKFFSLDSRGHVQESDSSCFVATVVYGCVNAPEVQRLREYRDKHLVRRRFGGWLVIQYYAWAGPWCAKLVAMSGDLGKSVVRRFLDSLIRHLPD